MLQQQFHLVPFQTFIASATEIMADTAARIGLSNS
jgi:hypothetical protein